MGKRLSLLTALLLGSAIIAGVGYLRIKRIEQRTGGAEAEFNKLRKAAAADPTDAGTRYKLACAYREKQLDDRALVEFRSVLELRPDHMPARLAAAEITYETGAYNQAAEHARHILKHQPLDADARSVLALALGLKGDYFEGLAHLDLLATEPAPENTPPQYRPPIPPKAAWLKYDTRRMPHPETEPDEKRLEAFEEKCTKQWRQARLDLEEDYNLNLSDELRAKSIILRRAVRSLAALAWIENHRQEPDAAKQTLDRFSNSVFGDFEQVTQARLFGQLLRAHLLNHSGRTDVALDDLEKHRDISLTPSISNTDDRKAPAMFSLPDAEAAACVRRGIARLAVEEERFAYAIEELLFALEYDPADTDILLPLANSWLFLAGTPVEKRKARVRPILEEFMNEMNESTGLSDKEKRARRDVVLSILSVLRKGGDVDEQSRRRIHDFGVDARSDRPSMARRMITAWALLTPEREALERAITTAEDYTSENIHSTSGRMMLAMALLDRYRERSASADELADQARHIERLLEPYRAARRTTRKIEMELDRVRKQLRATGQRRRPELRRKIESLTEKSYRAKARARETLESLEEGDLIGAAGEVEDECRRLRERSAKARFLAEKDRDNGCKHLKRLRNTYPTFWPATVLGVELITAERPSEAAEMFEETVRSDAGGSHARHWIGLATALLEAGRYGEALERISEAAKSSTFSDNTLVHEMLLLTRIVGGGIDGTDADNTSATPLKAGVRPAWNRLAEYPRHAAVATALGISRGMLLMAYNEYDAAEAEFSTAAEVVPDSRLSRIWLDRLSKAQMKNAGPGSGNNAHSAAGSRYK